MKGKNLLYGSRYLAPLFRWIIGLIFIYASWDKLQHPADFAGVIYEYRILPQICINVFAVILPWMEFVCGVLLISGFFKKGSILIINLLLTIFLIAIAVNLVRGLEIGCGCFSLSNINNKIDVSYLVRNLVMISMGFYVFFSADA